MDSNNSTKCWPIRNSKSGYAVGRHVGGRTWNRRLTRNVHFGHALSSFVFWSRRWSKYEMWKYDGMRLYCEYNIPRFGKLTIHQQMWEEHESEINVNLCVVVILLLVGEPRFVSKREPAHWLFWAKYGCSSCDCLRFTQFDQETSGQSLQDEGPGPYQQDATRRDPDGDYEVLGWARWGSGCMRFGMQKMAEMWECK
jgi:hypothetical protein